MSIEKPQDSLGIIVASLLRSAPGLLMTMFLGVILLVYLWIDHALGIDFTSRGNILNIPISKTIYCSSAILILAPIFVLLAHRFYVFCKKIYLRKKYPRNLLDKDFFLTHLNGQVFLFDTRDKSRRWIKTWHTLADLGFEHEWTDVAINLKAPNSKTTNTLFNTNLGKQYDLQDFNPGEPIFTQDTGDN